MKKCGSRSPNPILSNSLCCATIFSISNRPIPENVLKHRSDMTVVRNRFPPELALAAAVTGFDHVAKVVIESG